MLKHQITVLFCTIISFSSISSQFEYYDYINIAEETFVLKKDKKCFFYFEKAFCTDAKYFAKDAYVASEIAMYFNDVFLVKKYLQLAFELGMPITAIYSGNIFKNNITSDLYNDLMIIYKNCNKREINEAIRDSVYTYCFQSDSIKFLLSKNPNLEHLYYNSENRFRDYLYNNFLKHGAFPNENMIGIASDSIFNDFLFRFHHTDQWKQAELELFGFSEPEIMENDFVSKFSFSVLLHSTCTFTKFEPLLYNAVENGFLLPSEFALLKETGIVWTKKANNQWDDCILIYEDSYYNILGNNPFARIQTFVDPLNLNLIAKVEENRKAIHMQKFIVDQEKHKIQKQLGIRFFFGFVRN